jgi:hypothetical protein
MSDQPMTGDDVHAQVHVLRAQLVEPPERIELGRKQIAAIEAAQRQAAGSGDIGPLLEFQGLLIIKSERDDHVKLLAAGEQGEEVAPAAAVAPAPPVPVAEAPLVE